eukprot:1045273-Prymnesium_polylepis.1
MADRSTADNSSECRPSHLPSTSARPLSCRCSPASRCTCTSARRAIRTRPLGCTTSPATPHAEMSELRYGKRTNTLRETDGTRDNGREHACTQ